MVLALWILGLGWWQYHFWTRTGMQFLNLSDWVNSFMVWNTLVQNKEKQYWAGFLPQHCKTEKTPMLSQQRWSLSLKLCICDVSTESNYKLAKAQDCCKGVSCHLRKLPFQKLHWGSCAIRGHRFVKPEGNFKGSKMYLLPEKNTLWKISIMTVWPRNF